MRANLGSRRMFGELRCRDGEVEQEVDAKACLRVEEVCARRRIEAKPDGRYLAVAIVEITSPFSFRRETSSSPRS